MAGSTYTDLDVVVRHMTMLSDGTNTHPAIQRRLITRSQLAAAKTCGADTIRQ